MKADPTTPKPVSPARLIDDQAVTPLAPTGTEHAPPARGQHPPAKTVRSHALAAMGLKRSFRHLVRRSIAEKLVPSNWFSSRVPSPPGALGSSQSIMRKVMRRKK